MSALTRPSRRAVTPAGPLLIFALLAAVLAAAPASRARLAARQTSQNATPAAGAQAAGPLETGKPVESALKGEGAHLYEIKLAAGQLLDAVVEQRGIDVVVTVFGPDGKTLLRVDSPNGDSGPEPVTLIAMSGGVYRLEVRALEKGAAPGRYEVKVNEIRAATDNDAALLESAELERQAEAFYNQRRYDQAIALEERALAIREKLPIPRFPKVVETLTNLANLYDTKRDLARAIEYAERALPMVEQALGPEHSEVAARLNNIAVLYESKRDYVRAEPPMRRALEISEKVEGARRPDVVAFRLNNLALLLVNKGEYTRAEPLYERALAIAEKLLGPDHVMIATLLANSSQLYTAKGEYARAEGMISRAIAIREKALGAEHPDVATLLDSLGEIYRQKGEYARAEPLYLRALSILEKKWGAETYEVGTTLNNLALLYIEEGDYARAEPLYQRARAIYEKQLGPEHPFVATVMAGLAGLYDAKGEYARAEPLLLQALSLREKAFGPEHLEVALSLNNLALFYEKKGEYLKAEPLFQRALTISEKVLGAGHPTIATLLNNLGGLYETRGDLARAEALYQRALKIREAALGPEHPDVAVSLNNIALFHMKHGSAARAEPLFLKVLSIWEKSLGEGHPSLATALNNLAGLYEKTGDTARVEALYRRSLEIREKALGPEHVDVASSLNSLALLYQWRGDYARAEPMYLRALSIYEKAFGGEHPDMATLLSNLAEFYRMRGDAARAVKAQSRADEISERYLALLLTTGSEEQKRLYASTLSDETDYTISLHARNLPDNEEAARLALTTLLRRKGRVLDAMSDQVRSLRGRLTPEDLAVFEQLSTARARLAAAMLKDPGGNAAAEHRALITSLEGEVGRLEAEVSRRSAEFKAQSQPVTLESVQAAIPEKAALVEITLYRPFKASPRGRNDRRERPRYTAYILFRTGPPAFVDLGEASEIDADVLRFRAALSDPQRADVKALAGALDKKVMLPVRRLLGGRRQILLSPDGALNLVPFGALADEGGRYVVEDYSVTYLTSGRDLLRYGRAAEGRRGPVVVANPLFDARPAARANSPSAGAAYDANARRSAEMTRMKFEPLPGTAAEAKEVASALAGAEVLTQGNATEEALRRLAGPSILHIATHGFFLQDRPPAAADNPGGAAGDGPSRPSSENPLLRSGLALAGANERQDGHGGDGLLTALEASGLDLWGTSLVVLSACETGVGDVSNGEGVYGLRRALVLAGAESQVISLWKVSDIATRELMADYYGRLQKGEGRAEALRHVQIDMLRKDARKHPFYWAGFIQSGDWRGLDLK